MDLNNKSKNYYAILKYMEYIKTDIEGVYILKPRLFNDARGYFTETYKKEDFDLNDKEMAIIRSHMWPLTLFHPPQSKEAVVVMMADKYCAVREMVFRKKTV